MATPATRTSNSPTLSCENREALRSCQITLRSLVANPKDSALRTRRVARLLVRASWTRSLDSLRRVADAVMTAQHDDWLRAAPVLLRAVDDALKETAPHRPTRLLLVDDDPHIIAFEQAILETSDRSIEVAMTLKAAREKLGKQSFEVVVLDLDLPDGDGRDLLVEQTRPNDDESPAILVLSSRGSVLTRAECLALGAESMLAKPVDPGVLATTVATMVSRRAKQTRRAMRDPLTGLLNRVGLGLALKSLETSAAFFALAVIDLDGFKQVNDTLGHLAGDTILTRFSSALVGRLRETDICSRWGGDEFIAVFPNTTVEGARAALADLAEIVRTDPALRIQFTAGISAGQVQADMAACIAKADAELYFQRKVQRSSRSTTP